MDIQNTCCYEVTIFTGVVSLFLSPLLRESWLEELENKSHIDFIFDKSLQKFFWPWPLPYLSFIPNPSSNLFPSPSPDSNILLLKDIFQEAMKQLIDFLLSNVYFDQTFKDSHIDEEAFPASQLALPLFQNHLPLELSPGGNYWAPLFRSPIVWQSYYGAYKP